MIEAEWLAAADRPPIHLFPRRSRRAGKRKFRPFGAACCRRA